MTTTNVGIKLTLDGAQQTEAGLRRVAGGVDSVGQSASKAGSGLSQLGTVAGGLAAGLGAAFAVNQLAAFSQELVAVQRRFDVLNASMVTVAGSQAAAAREFEWIREFAATTPFQLNEVTQAFIKLKSLGLDASRDSLSSYGNTAAALGKNLDQLIEAVADASTGEFERLKEFGIRASKQGDQIALTFRGVTTTIGDSAEEITRYLRQIGEVDFAGAMEERAKTLDGAISNLADSWETFTLTIARSGFGDAVANDVRGVSSELGLLTEVMENARKRGDSLAGVLADGLGAALGRLGFSAVEGTFNGFNGIVNALTGNVLNLNTNLDLLPDNLKSNADQVVILGAKLKDAEAEFAKLQERAKVTPDNIYLKSEMAQLAQYIVKVREARDAKALLEGGAGGGQINAEEEKAAAARAKARADFDAKYATDAEKIKTELAKQRKLLGDTFTAEDERRIIASLTKVGAKVKEVGDAFAAQREFAKNWADAWSKADDLLRDVTTESLGLNKAQEQLLAYLTSPAYEQNTEAMRELVLQKLYAADAQIKLNEAMAAEKRWMDESNQANQRAAEAAYDAADSLEDQVRQQQRANEEIGLTGYALAELKAARLEDAAAEKERLAAIMQGTDPGIADEYRRQAKAMRELANGTRVGGAKTEAVDAAREAEKEWLRTSQEIERSLTDALMRGFESGKDFAEVLRDTVVNMFKTMVLRPVIQGVVQGGLNAVGLGGPGGGGSGLLGSAANAASLYNQLPTGTGLVGSVLASNAAYGAAIGTTSIGAGSQAAMLAAQTGQFGAAGVAATSQAAAGAGAGASSALSAIPGWGWALAGLALLAGGGFGKTPGEQAMGGYYSSTGKDATLDNAMAVTGGGGWDNGAWARDLIERPDAGLKTFTQTTVDAVLASAKDSAKALGLDIALGIDAGFAANLNGEGTDKNAFGYAQIFANGELAGSYSNRELGTDLKAAGEKFAGELYDATAEVLLAGTDFGRAGETAGQTLTRLGSSLTTVNGIFDTLGTTVYQTSLAGADMASQLADAFGGLENLTALTSSFYEAYYTEGERAATTTRQLTEALGDMGLTLPTSRDAFRDLVEAQDLTTEAGRETYAALMQLSPAFASVSQSAVDAARSMSDAWAQVLQARGSGDVDRFTAQAAIDAAWMEYKASDRYGIVNPEQFRTITQADFANYTQREQQLIATILTNIARRDAFVAGGSSGGSTASSYFSELQGLTNAALDGLVSAIDAERELADLSAQSAREAVSAIESVFGVIDTSLQSLYQQSTTVVQQSAVEARTLIAQVLGGGALPGSGELSAAIQAVQGGFEKTVYTTAFEAERDRLLFAGELKRLREAGGEQMTVAEQQLQAAEEQLTSLQAQLDAAQESVNVLRGIDTSVKSVSDAIAALQAAVLAEQRGVLAGTGSPSGGAGGSGSGGFVTGGGGTSSGGSTASYTPPESPYASLLASPGSIPRMAGETEAQALARVQAQEEAFQARALAKWQARQQIAAFADGGLHAGGLRLVGERGPELEVTGPSRIFSAEQTRLLLQGGADNTALLAELRALRADNRAQAGALVRLQGEVAKLLKRWDGNGMPEQRVTS